MIIPKLYRQQLIVLKVMSNLNIEEVNNEELEINFNIYRYKFTKEFTDDLYEFSKIHQFDHRKDFKEAWNLWVEENREIVDDEIRRLSKLGYDGDILDKMFKSARYYFRKKNIEKKIPAKRCKYICIEKDLLSCMDEHIKYLSNMDDSYKPSEGFDDFCEKKIDLLKEVVNSLYKNGFYDSEEIKKKIKKTYKNRYFIFIHK